MSEIDKALEAEFLELQKELMKHRYLYYVKDNPVISDYDYDMMECKSFELARKLGFRADKWDAPEENEREHVHYMVDFNHNHPLAKEIIEKHK